MIWLMSFLQKFRYCQGVYQYAKRCCNEEFPWDRGNFGCAGEESQGIAGVQIHVLEVICKMVAAVGLWVEGGKMLN